VYMFSLFIFFLELYVSLMSSSVLFLVAFGAGPRLPDPQLSRVESGEADFVSV